MLQLREVQEILKSSPLSTEKSYAKALKLKTDGNNYFQKKNLAQALSSYNEAIRLTPVSDNEGLLAVCFANRSAVFYSMNRHEDCLMDIDLSINHGYPLDMQYKLLARRAKCLQYCSDTNLLSSCVEAALHSLELSGLDEKRRSIIQEDISKLSIKSQAVDRQQAISSCSPSIGPLNQQYPALSSSAGVCESNEYGRYIRAQSNINVGDVVLTETPYCSVTLPESYFTHCSSCQARTDKLYPCRSCADVIFCSQVCEEVSWQQWHRFECKYSLSLKFVDINMGHLALRTALKVGHGALSDVLKGNLNQPDVVKYYESIYILEGHDKDRSCKDLLWRTAAAVMLAQLCDVTEWSGSSEDGLVTLAAFTLRHMQIFPCNAHEISQVIYDESQPSQSALVEVGAGIYSTLSLFNHSCDPSVVRIFHEGNTCVMKAISPIKELEQIYDNYGCLHATHSLEDRREKLSSQYYFHCCCASCMQNWNLYSQLSFSDTPLYKCTDCGSMIIPPYSGNCDDCGALFDRVAVDKMLTKAKKGFDQVLTDLFTKSYRDYDIAKSTKAIQAYSQLVNSLVFRPAKTLNDSQEALKHIYSLQGNVLIKSSTA